MTSFQLTPEIISTIFGIIFAAGAFYSIQKRLEIRMKESEKDLRTVTLQQVRYDEKINKIDEKINKMELQNNQIINILTREKVS